MSINPNDVTSYTGQPQAHTGDVFEGTFAALTYWAMTGQTAPSNSTIILDTGQTNRQSRQNDADLPGVAGHKIVAALAEQRRGGTPRHGCDL